MIETHLDWSAYSGRRRRLPGRGRDVQQQRRLPQARRRRDVPELSRHPRRARRHARPRQYAAARASPASSGRTRSPPTRWPRRCKLCVSCKACRRECPTGVDMARMKIEVQAARAAKHGLSLHDRLVGWLPRYAPYAARQPWLFNLRDDSPRAAPCCRRRSPAFQRAAQPAEMARATFTRTAPTGLIRRATAGDAERAKSCCSPTPSTAISSARISTPRLRVLVAGGYRVHALLPADGDARPLCCGRTFLSVGQVDEAQARDGSARSQALAPYVARGVPVVGLEPSCLLELPRRDAGADQGRGGRALAGSALLLEEFLAREQAAGRLNLPLGPLPTQGAGARPLPSEGVRRHGRGRKRAQARSRARGRADRIELLRHGRRVRLCGRHHRRVAQDGRVVAAAGGAQEPTPTR